MFVRLYTGTLDSSVIKKGENFIEKDAVIVYPGTFQSMDGEVVVTEEHVKKLVTKHNSLINKAVRLATGEVALKYCPPVQVDHSRSATKTVGRLLGNIRAEKREIDGEEKLCVMGRVRVLGKANTEKVEDGRWIHLSVGADFDAGILEEVSITPFPAAGVEAAMLARGINNKGLSSLKREEFTIQGKKFVWTEKSPGKGDIWYKEDGQTHHVGQAPNADEAKKFVKGNISRFSKGEQKMNLKALIAKLAKKKKMTEDEAEKEVKAMSEEEKEKLASEEDGSKENLEGDKDKDKDELEGDDKDKDNLESDDDKDKDKLSEDEEKAKKAELTAAKTKIVELARGVRSANKAIQLSAKKSEIMTRLSKLRGEGKITPAEIKKSFDDAGLTRLAQSPQEHLEAIMSTYDNREPVIDATIYGSASAEDIAQIAERVKTNKLTEEALGTMKFTSQAIGKHLKKKMQAESDEAEGLTEGEEKAEEKLKALAEDYSKCTVDADKESVLKKMRAITGSFVKLSRSPRPSHDVLLPQMDGKKDMAELAENVKRLQNQFDELLTLVGPAIGMTKAELEG